MNPSSVYQCAQPVGQQETILRLLRVSHQSPDINQKCSQYASTSVIFIIPSLFYIRYRWVSKKPRKKNPENNE